MYYVFTKKPTIQDIIALSFRMAIFHCTANPPEVSSAALNAKNISSGSCIAALDTDHHNVFTLFQQSTRLSTLTELKDEEHDQEIERIWNGLTLPCASLL